jgi:hypothetical protein
MKTPSLLRYLVPPAAFLVMAGSAGANVIIYDGLEGGSGDVENVLYTQFSGQEGNLVQGSLAQSGEIPPEVLMSLPSPDDIARRAEEAKAKAQAALAAQNP